MTNAIQVSIKLTNGTIAVIGAADVPTFELEAKNLLGERDGEKLVGVVAQAFAAVIDDEVKLDNWHAGVQARAVSTAVKHAGAEMVSDEGSQGIVEDRWGKKWDYSDTKHDCQHGPRVKMSAISRAGKPYTGYACQVGGPKWQGDRAAKCDMVFDD